MEDKTLLLTASDMALVSSTSVQPPRKRKRPKGPNPLSVKKKAMQASMASGKQSLEVSFRK
jgi:hypothetical protein